MTIRQRLIAGLERLAAVPLPAPVRHEADDLLIELAGDTLLIAGLCADCRSLQAFIDLRKVIHGDFWRVKRGHFIGALAEIAVALAFDLRWTPLLDGAKIHGSCDLPGGIEVRSSEYRHVLVLYPPETRKKDHLKGAHPFYFVRVEMDEAAGVARCAIKGWLYGSEVMQDRYWNENERVWKRSELDLRSWREQPTLRAAAA